MASRKPTTRPASDYDAIVEHAELLSPELQEAVLREAARRFGSRDFFKTTEELISSKEGFGLETISPLQRAICRLADGRALGRELLNNPDIAEALGLSKAELAVWEQRRQAASYALPQELFLIAGIRTFKSMLLAANAIMATQRVDTKWLQPFEIPRYSVISISMDNAKVVYQHLLGALKKPKLQSLVISDAEMEKWAEWKDILKETAGRDRLGSIFLWNAARRPVEIRVVAASRSGGSGVSRWSAGLGLDEAPRMVGAEDGVVNYTDVRRAMLGRLLPGAQILSVGSPWGASGPVFDIVKEWWGQPTQDLVIVRGTGPKLNPIVWTPEACEKLRQKDPIAYKMDVLGEFTEQGESYFTQELLAPCVRPGKERAYIAYEPGHSYVAAMDPATRGNSWTLTVGDRVRGEGGKTVKRVVFATQWTGSSVDPLKPREVLKEIAEILKSYQLDWLYTDQFAADFLKDLAQPLGIALVVEDWNGIQNFQAYACLHDAFADRSIEIPDDPILQRDLRLARRSVTVRGPTIHLPTTTDGRHCDYAPALARMFKRWIDSDRDSAPAPAAGTVEAVLSELAKWREAAYEKVRTKKERDADWMNQDPYSAPESVFDTKGEKRW